MRRWNNANFVNLAAELSAGGGGGAAAARALLLGSAAASKHRSIMDPSQHQSKAMTQFREDDALGSVRRQFFEGELPNPVTHPTRPSTFTGRDDFSSLTPLERFHSIDGRLRRILVKACVNSYAATKVVRTLEEFLVRAHSGREGAPKPKGEWQEFLLEPPTATSHRGRGGDVSVGSGGSSHPWSTRFLFDADSATGGFHRLLLRGVCQFHGLRAASSTMDVMVGTETKKARVLAATGSLSRSASRIVCLVDFISNREKNGVVGIFDDAAPGNEMPLTGKLATLKV